MHPQALFTDDLIPLLKRAIQISTASKVVMITDDNTSKYCLPILSELNFDLHYELKSGEENKTQTAYFSLLEYLIEHKLDRRTLLIALGGGVVSDLVGFVASSFKRGVSYISVPTTLLAMVDASTGGKTGIDHKHVKNIIGAFYPPLCILSNSQFLETLPQEELNSGWAEVIKHLLISNQEIPCKPLELSNMNISNWSLVKYRIIREDPYEQGARLALNAGHTIGHTLESLSLIRNQPIPHGYAVAQGLLVESLITKSLYKDTWAFDQLHNVVPAFFGKLTLNSTDIPKIIALMNHDKKNKTREIRCSLIKQNGKLALSTVMPEIIEKSLLEYIEL